MIRRPPRSTRPDTLFPYTTLFRSLMARSIAILQRGFLSPAEIEASRAVMGLDKTLIADRTYWLASIDETLAGCGGWSRRATLYGGDHSTGLREDRKSTRLNSSH